MGWEMPILVFAQHAAENVALALCWNTGVVVGIHALCVLRWQKGLQNFFTLGKELCSQKKGGANLNKVAESDIEVKEQSVTENSQCRRI